MYSEEVQCYWRLKIFRLYEFVILYIYIPIPKKTHKIKLWRVEYGV